MKKIDDSSFDSVVLESAKPVVVDFSATWCGPCKMQKPVLEQLAAQRDDIDIVMIDVDESPKAGARFGVTAMPTLMLFDKGELKSSVVGLQNRKRLEAWLGETLG